jgi:hypothetical protein
MERKDEMRAVRSSVVRIALAALAVAMGSRELHAAQAASPAPDRPRKSVYGKLQSVEKRLSALVMVTDEGQRMVWKFNKELVADAEQFKPGDRMIVIYRQLGPSTKRVTAVAFPGSASSPTYVNYSGDRVTLRSAPLVDGACPAVAAEPLQEITIPREGTAELPDGCWCCTTAGDACTPANKTGVGRALLVNCFE